MKTIDLHAHSTASDGSYSPTELAEHAKEIGLSAIALTDHDTVDGLEEFMAAGKNLHLETIRGMETTVSVDDCDVHLVCLFFDPDYPALKTALQDLAASRDERNVNMVKALEKAGFPISMQDVKQYGDGAISRGHIAKALIHSKYHDLTPKELIKRYLSKGTVGYVKRRTPDPSEFIRIIHEAGGLVFVAHLHQIDPENPGHCIDICKRLLADGADGLETLYCEYDDFWREQTEAIAREYGVLRSGGSDFHGIFKPGLALGSGYGDLAVPDSFLEQIKKRLP